MAHKKGMTIRNSFELCHTKRFINSSPSLLKYVGINVVNIFGPAAQLVQVL